MYQKSHCNSLGSAWWCVYSRKTQYTRDLQVSMVYVLLESFLDLAATAITTAVHKTQPVAVFHIVDNVPSFQPQMWSSQLTISHWH